MKAVLRWTRLHIIIGCEYPIAFSSGAYRVKGPVHNRLQDILCPIQCTLDIIILSCTVEPVLKDCPIAIKI